VGPAHSMLSKRRARIHRRGKKVPCLERGGGEKEKAPHFSSACLKRGKDFDLTSAPNGKEVEPRAVCGDSARIRKKKKRKGALQHRPSKEEKKPCIPINGARKEGTFIPATSTGKKGGEGNEHPHHLHPEPRRAAGGEKWENPPSPIEEKVTDSHAGGERVEKLIPPF